MKTMKKCSKCNIEKDLSEFFFKNKEKGILHACCKECKRDLDRKSYHNNSERKQKIRKRANEQKKYILEYIRRVKSISSCNMCGDKRWYVLDFHHIKDKEFNITDLGTRGASIEKFKREIRKCITLCANCHREVHYLERKVL